MKFSKVSALISVGAVLSGSSLRLAYSQVMNDNIYLSQLVLQIRNPNTQTEHFRTAVSKIGEYLAIEVLQNLPVREVKIKTLTGHEASHQVSNEDPVLVTILRAGLPLIEGVQRVFQNSKTGFLATSRDEETLKPKTDYIGIPDVQNRTVILIDTMLATGGSMLDAIQIVERYHPKEIQILCAIAAQPGIDRLKAHNPTIKIYSAVIDPELNDKGYIVPGLGDAGDRSYGTKVTLSHPLVNI